MMRSARDRVVVLALVMGVGLLLGCDRGPRLVPVSGTVLIDGEPLEGAHVVFEPQEGGRPASGITDASGRFRLGTFEPGDGAVAGTNQVAVILLDMSTVPELDPETGDMPRGARPPQSITHPRYGSAKTSGLTVDVQRGMDPVTLEVSRQ